MRSYQEYLQPETITEAITILTEAPGSTAVIAGGTDLLLDLSQGRHPPVNRLVDVSGISEMGNITQEDDTILIGAGVTHKKIITNPLLKEHARCVVEGCGLIGGPQVRNVATIGGNVSHALPAGDGTVSLLALDTEVQIASPDGLIWKPLIEIFSGPGKLHLDRSRELVVQFRFQARESGEGSAFKRIMRPQGVAIAILNMAAWVKLNSRKELIAVRISCGPAGPTPFRAYETEKFLLGKIWGEAVFHEVKQVLGEEVNLRTSKHRATKEYRQQILPVLLQKVMDSAVSRAN